MEETINWSKPAKDWVGCTFRTLSCGLAEVVSYNGWKNVGVRFVETGYVGTFSAPNIKKRKVADVLAKSCYGVGFIGVGEYSATRNKKAYGHWSKMLDRCTSSSQAFDNYFDKSVVEDWHNFQNFAKWAEHAEGFCKDGWHIDKDILVPGNKTYGPDTCCFVPQRINSLIIKTDVTGYWSDRDGVWTFSYRDVKGRKNSRNFSVWEEGRDWYAQQKMDVVKQVAQEYRKDLDARVFEALHCWKPYET